VVEIPLDDSFMQEETAVVPATPRLRKPEGRPGSRPRRFQPTPHDIQQAPKPATPRPPSAPRIRRAGISFATPGTTPGIQPDTGSTPHIVLASPRAPSEHPVPTPPPHEPATASFMTLAPPSGPPPSRRPRPSPQVTEKIMRSAVEGADTHRAMSPRPPSQLTPHPYAASLHKTLNLKSCITPGHAAKSAMEMDLGEATACAAEVPQSTEGLISIMSKVHPHASSAKSSGLLPPILQQPTWSGIDAHCAKWKCHDMV